MQHIISLETRSISELNFMLRDAHNRLFDSPSGSPDRRLALAAIDMISLALSRALS
jgi:hypothetical protein